MARRLIRLLSLLSKAKGEARQICLHHAKLIDFFLLDCSGHLHVFQREALPWHACLAKLRLTLIELDHKRDKLISGEAESRGGPNSCTCFHA